MEANGYYLKMQCIIENFCAEFTYLGIKLDRGLTFRQHLESLRKKLTTCVGFLRRLAGSTWVSGATALRTATLALVHYAAEYCLLVWCQSAHTRLINKPINDALRIMTGCLHPIPIDNFIILAGILPTELRCQRAMLSLDCRAQGPQHILNKRLLSPVDETSTAYIETPFCACCTGTFKGFF